MENESVKAIIAEALAEVAERGLRPSDGRWLEDITVRIAPHIKEWDITACHEWGDWPERKARFPGSNRQDTGIDLVAERGDGECIAIQCKARMLDERGKGPAIPKQEIDSFAAASSGDFWAERWLVTNGNTPLSANVQQNLLMADKPIKTVLITNDLQRQHDALGPDTSASETRSRGVPADPDQTSEPPKRTKTCMQREAVSESARILRAHEKSDSGGLPKGQARGKIILPCGTGKTRISLRIVEELTALGELSVVLCPSIALVAQIRREYLQHARIKLRPLAVCSDKTAGFDPKREGARNAVDDPTRDYSFVSESEVIGHVTTNPDEIAGWIAEGRKSDRISVIFGTYQSGRNIADALEKSGATIKVLIADEAHRTAGLRRKKKNGNANASAEEEKRLREFTLCHDNEAFPTIYRIYQTATPRVYDASKPSKDGDWIVRTMDDETIFGVELYRKSYVETVRNGWLADYRIIALGINDEDAFKQANQLAKKTESKGRNALTTAHYLKGLAFTLAMGGATSVPGDKERVTIKSCIAFMNTVDKSKNMAKDLQTGAVRDWLRRWLLADGRKQEATRYTLEHLDASSNVAARENEKLRLAQANATAPHGVINVGIFGEGTDSPSLSAVAFLEPRKSPIDVIQAVGRVMRSAPGKERGYIVCPVLIPPNVDPERWLSASSMGEGWQELGEILLALRAHDSRIEDDLSELLRLYLPEAPETQHTLIAIADGATKRIRYRTHAGPPGEAEKAVERVLDGQSAIDKEFSLLPDSTKADALDLALIITGKKNDDGKNEIRIDTVERAKPTSSSKGDRGPVDIGKSKAKAQKMINKSAGRRATVKTKKKHREETTERVAKQLLMLTDMDSEHGHAISMNLLSRSGLAENRVIRDLNILEDSIKEAAHHLRSDGLQPVLDRHFDLNHLKESKREEQADGCVIAALLMMNAAMLHQRIAQSRWIGKIDKLEIIKNDPDIVRLARRTWGRILDRDYKPVLRPAVDVIELIEDTRKLAGLERALRHLTTESARIADTYANLGADHAGPLFNRVMGNQASDGAYFTKPIAGSIVARLALDVCGDMDWTDETVLRSRKIVDLACGSGTLLAAVLAEMKRRAKARDASEEQIARLQRLAVEDTLKGLDINPISLQLAAAQLTTGHKEIRYQRMGLHLMPYGPDGELSLQVFAGTLELLGRRGISPRSSELALMEEEIGTNAIWCEDEGVSGQIEDVVREVKNADLIIMNPPFTNRAKMGEKFLKDTQKDLRDRVDLIERKLTASDREMANFGSGNSIGPTFVALADQCLHEDGVLAMINPTITLCATSGLNERWLLARRYHIHTVLTCHQPGQVNMSQNTNINESVIIAKKRADNAADSPSPTRFINLDRLPMDEAEVENLHQCLSHCERGALEHGWGEVFHWPEERIEAGDWSAAAWRSPELAEAASNYASDDTLPSIKAAGFQAHATGQVLRGDFEPAEAGAPGSFPILKSKGADSQMTIRSEPDEYWIPKRRDEQAHEENGGIYPIARKLLQKSGYLLVTAGQDTSTGRLTATASQKAYVGNGWMPVTGLTVTQAKALAVWLNSTVGRLQLMRTPGRKLAFPTYSAKETNSIRIPDVSERRVCRILADCWTKTKSIMVPQFREGDCDVRETWDDAVATAMGWDRQKLARLRALLGKEPHVRGLGYSQYSQHDGG